MTINQDVNVRLLFRFYNKAERRYLTDKEARKITYNSLSDRQEIAIEQCTGFYDQWQIELIYEGDVVKDESGYTGIVYFEQTTGQYLYGEYKTLAHKKLEKKLAFYFFLVYNDYVENERSEKMIEKISNFIVGLAIVMSIVAGMTCLMSHQAKQMQQYAVEHNCRWDYNDMCYTREQRPWLFEE